MLKMADDYLVRANELFEYLKKLRCRNQNQARLLERENAAFDVRIAGTLQSIKEKTAALKGDDIMGRIEIVMGANEIYDICGQQCILICQVCCRYRLSSISTYCSVSTIEHVTLPSNRLLYILLFTFPSIIRTCFASASV